MKKENIFLKYKENIGDSSIVFRSLGQNYNATKINGGLVIIDVERVVMKGVKARSTQREDQFNQFHPSDEEKSSLDNLFNEVLVRFDINTLPDIAISILNVEPTLRSSTLMGWEPFEDKSKNPNYYSGSYYLPDGNVYTIVKSSEWIGIYPCEGGHTLTYGGQLPLFEFNIDTKVWARKVYEKSNEVLEIIKRIS